MADIVSREVRSRMMSGIRGKNTKPELIVRKALFAQGFRYRLHVKNLPGKPDIVLPKYHAVIFVHGCFWHGHNCHLFKLPASNRAFWRAKIKRNQENDRKTIRALRKDGWKVLTVWECALRARQRLPENIFANKLRAWILSKRGISSLKARMRHKYESRTAS